jgi:hypothetical protein
MLNMKMVRKSKIRRYHQITDLKTPESVADGTFESRQEVSARIRMIFKELASPCRVGGWVQIWKSNNIFEDLEAGFCRRNESNRIREETGKLT